MKRSGSDTPSRLRCPSLFLIALGVLTGASTHTSAAPELSSLMDMSLMDLAAMPVTVTSVSKQPETLREAASAIHVIDQEDIRRSGATTVPELLRMVPGVEVARIDASKWAISARGGNHEFANKLLVMIDGRSVYTPMFGGVYWDAQSLPLRDIERIEVIRGPGASLWGANAMNGVINIITRSAEETQGGVVSGYAGTAERLMTLRQGVELGDQTFMRVWVHGQTVDSLKRPNNLADDAWKTSQLGFRLDSHQGQQRWELDGKLHQGTLDDTSLVPSLTRPYSQLLDDEVETGGGHLRVKWERPLTESHTLTIQTYYDQSDRKRDFYDEILHTLDVDVQHSWTMNESQQWLWGANIRHSWDKLESGPPLQFYDENGESRLQSLFGQYTHRVADGRGKWVLGAKFSHTNRSDFNTQPSLKFSWDLNDDHMFWSSVSRSVRTPTRYEHGSRYDFEALANPMGAAMPPILNIIQADGTFSEETMTAYEIGMRNQFTPSLSLDTALFYNQYKDLLALKAGATFLETDPQPTHIVVPSTQINYSEATSYGFESSLDWTPASEWQLAISYSFLDIELSEKPASDIFELTYLARYSPRHQVKLRSYYSFAQNWELDAHVYYTDELEAMSVDAYTRMDLRLGWNPLPRLQLSLGGKNLLENDHQEFGRSLVALPSEVERSFYINAAYAY